MPYKLSLFTDTSKAVASSFRSPPQFECVAYKWSSKVELGVDRVHTKSEDPSNDPLAKILYKASTMLSNILTPIYSYSVDLPLILRSDMAKV